MSAGDSLLTHRLLHIERLVDAIDLPIGRWDREARLVFCNNPYLGWAERSREELIGRTLHELYGEDAWRRAEPAFAEAFCGRTVNYERRLTHGHQSARWARIQVFPDLDPQGRVEAVFTIAFDIHEDVLAREALEAARERLDRFTENIPYPLTYVDRGFVLRFVNKAYCEATGMRAADLLGRHIGEVRGARRWSEHAPFFERALKGQTVQYTRLVDRLPQGPRWLRTSYVPDFDARRHVRGLYTVTIDVHELTMAQEKLKRSVERDSLTDVLSRRTMMDRIEAAMLEAAERPVALFFVDLDGFKGVNDRLGHQAGDQLLVDVGAALQSAVRIEDAVGRFGGDEFLVLAAVRDSAGAEALALHMLDAVRQMSSIISASIGYALAPSDAQHPMKLLQLADDAMYAAKRLGKNRVMHHREAPCVPLDGSSR
ncbi:diguanylate cyclase [Piscinibacter sp. XHJ-5]|uniref:diguanylate cyclase n=1 Tax=Piscinibacter sp. XHJ-5 TaxID=3037797 RepID=UPI002452C7DE|nr:diguanylate cyclase [Piscinibacter sp. XHJ-5]